MANLKKVENIEDIKYGLPNYYLFDSKTTDKHGNKNKPVLVYVTKVEIEGHPMDGGRQIEYTFHHLDNSTKQPIPNPEYPQYNKTTTKANFDVLENLYEYDKPDSTTQPNVNMEERLNAIETRLANIEAKLNAEKKGGGQKTKRNNKKNQARSQINVFYIITNVYSFTPS